MVRPETHIVRQDIPPAAPPGAVGAAEGGVAESRRSYTVQRGPWSPAQAVALILGVVFLVLGGIALARTGVNLNNLTGTHVTVAGAGQTELMAYIELVFGAFLVAAGAAPGAGRGGMTLLGLVALVFGIIVVAQPSSFRGSLGIGDGYGIFLIVVGAVLVVAAMLSPVYWGARRRTGATQRWYP